jgi:hypothetical protein
VLTAAFVRAVDGRDTVFQRTYRGQALPPFVGDLSLTHESFTAADVG